MEGKVFNIGIVGTDSSHAEIFSKLVNLPDSKTKEYLISDFKVTAIYGQDYERTKGIAYKTNIEFIAEKPQDMIDKVDGVMILCRDGNLHKNWALPFIERGISTWIDKPFTIRDSDAEKIITSAVKYNTLVTGGSTCKYSYNVIETKEIVESRDCIGRINAGFINFNTSFQNPYGGIYFYGSHLAEMALEIFGYNPRSIISSKNNAELISVLNYENYQVVLSFVEGFNEQNIIVIGEKGTIVRQIDMEDIYKQGLLKFAQMLRTGIMPFPLKNLYTSVKILNAIVKSWKTKKEILLEEV